ncbi:DUF2795 domain-containing protein [Asanoa sp. WMMD1127]|uniref:DUF2795 domain-containing protein n=1 Tax=Asanoa sp. WMMD1127 TaxID=3016107 RepID=UPI00241693B6|nr:DUF2795 domain-containing protein [Asanoa sp. WMMD1127]MDG4825365.1 DUF2795 domain-containing protein [Asanoa sp. WMMD1127]
MEKKRWEAVAAVLRDAGFPVNRQDLVNHARLQGADDATLWLIRQLPIGVYRNLVEVRDRAERLPDVAATGAVAAPAR